MVRELAMRCETKVRYTGEREEGRSAASEQQEKGECRIRKEGATRWSATRSKWRKLRVASMQNRESEMEAAAAIIFH